MGTSTLHITVDYIFSRTQNFREFREAISNRENSVLAKDRNSATSVSICTRALHLHLHRAGPITVFPVLVSIFYYLNAGTCAGLYTGTK